MKDNPMQWSQTVPTISRLDYIATALFAAHMSNPNPSYNMDFADAVIFAKTLIAELDKEQSRED